VILLIRGQKVMLDSDLAELYGVLTYRLNEKVKRNLKRFPPDFMFQLSSKEFQALRSHFAMSKRGRGGRRYPPYAFTEQGVAMLSSVLNSERAIEVNILIMRTFVKLREMISTHKELANKFDAYLLLQLPARFGRLPTATILSNCPSVRHRARRGGCGVILNHQVYPACQAVRMVYPV
jgi:hypothetical protein